MSRDGELPRLGVEVRLSAEAVILPVIMAARNSIDVIALGLAALEGADFDNLPHIPGSLVKVTFPIGGETDEERRAHYRDWLVMRGFHELARGLRMTLEEAYVYCEVLRRAHELKTLGQLTEVEATLRKRADRFDAEELVRKLNRRLLEPIELAPQLLSLNHARNCLEHRRGIVGDKDTDGAAVLDLALPYMKVFHLVDREEVEVRPGDFFPHEVLVLTRRDLRRRTFALGERIAFAPAEFEEIAHGCHLLGVDVVARLPRELPPRPAAAPEG